MTERDLTQEMQGLAKAAVDMTREALQKTLDYSEAGLEVVDESIAWLREASEQRPDDREAIIRNSATRYGAFVGEVLRRTLGGRWVTGLEGLPEAHPGVLFGPGVAVPMVVVGNLIAHGEAALGEESILSVVEYYRGVSARQAAWLQGRVSGEHPSMEALLAAVADERDLAGGLVQQTADAIMTGLVNWHVDLDLSPDSVAVVEAIVGRLHEHATNAPEGQGPTEEQMRKLIVQWGVYLGEVVRRALGGHWTNSELPDQGPTLRLVVGEGEKAITVFPLAKVQKRMTQGESEELTHYVNVVRTLVTKGVDGLSMGE